MTNRMIDNRVKKIEALEAEIAAKEAELNALKDELKKDMLEKGVDKIDTGNYVLYYKEEHRSDFDKKAFRKDHEDLYNEYLKDKVLRPFRKYAA